MTANMASSLPTLILPALSCTFQRFGLLGGVHFPSLLGKVGSLWLTLEYCDLGIADAAWGLLVWGVG